MFLRLNIRYTVIKLVCLVLCFKPFKIPFSVSCGLYRNNDRNKKTDLSCCNIQPTEIPRFRCPFTTAPVRTEGLFWRPHGYNIATGKDPPSEAVAEAFQSFYKKIFRRGFLFSPENSELYLCPTNWHLSDKGARSARPGPLPSRDPFLSHIWIAIVNRQTEMPGSLKLRVISTLSGSMKSSISASTNCSVRPDQSITAVVLSSKESSTRSSSSSNATLRRCSSSPG